MRKVLTMLLLAFLYGNAVAQKLPPKEMTEGRDVRAVYSVADRLNAKDDHTEVWTFRLIPERVGSRIYLTNRITKERGGEQPERTTEIHKMSWSEIRSDGESTYRKEVFTVRPAMLQPGQFSLGYVEEWDVPDDRVVREWPSSYEAVEIPAGRRLVFRAALPNGTHQEIIRDYARGENIFPLREIRIERYGGAVVRDTIHIRQN